jgi:phage tail-like protein
MPNVSSAVARELRVVRVTFSGALADLSAGTNGALNPANWSFAGEASGVLPAAEVFCSAVAQVTSSVLDVTADAEFSPGRTYLVTAKPAATGGITGVAAPLNVGGFIGVTPAAPADRDFSVPDMIPQINFREDETQDLIKFVNVLDETIQIALSSVDRWTDILDYDTAPENFVDLMLQDLGYPFAIALSLIDKRRLLSVLVTMYKQKGTAIGLKNAIRFFVGYESDIVVQPLEEWGWILGESQLDYDAVLGGDAFYSAAIYGTDVGTLFEADATRYDFIVKVGTPNAVALTAEEDKKVRAVVEYMKPVHTHMVALVACLPPPATVSAIGSGGAITVSWSTVTGAAKYVVFESLYTGLQGASPGAQFDPDDASPFVDTVASGVKNYYAVCAQAGGINGVMSAEISATAL